jgi:hypothetical protein
VPIEAPPIPNLVDPLALALGAKGWSYHPSLPGTTTALTAGTINATAVYLTGGQTITNCLFIVGTAAVGTTPTLMQVGIASLTTMLAQSANLAASAIWTAAGVAVGPLSAPLVVPASGLYYVLLLQTGAYGTTQPGFQRTSALAGVSGSAAFTAMPWGTAGVGAVNLPANNTAVVYAAGGFPYWAGLS